MRNILRWGALPALLLTLCLFLLPTKAEAATDGSYSYFESGGEAWVYDVDSNISGDVTIPSTLGGYPVTKIEYSAFNYCQKMTSVTIPDTVKEIQGNVFGNCTALTGVVIGNGVSIIGERAFYGCSSLTNVTFGTNVATISKEAFYQCKELVSITLPDSVTTIGERAFASCYALTDVTIGSGVVSIGDGAFTFCEALSGIWVSNRNTVYSSDAYGILFNDDYTALLFCPAGYTGAYCIPNSVVTIESSAFYLCKKMTGVTIPDSVTSIESSAYYGCSKLVTVSLGSSVTTIGNSAFRGCSSLTEITIPNSVTTIDGYAFYGCSSLTAITIPDSVTAISYSTFNNCRKLTSVDFGNGITSIGSEAFYYCVGLTSITIPDGVTGVHKGAFSGCSGLTNVTLGSGVKAIGESAFSSCSKLMDITIPSSVTSIGRFAFSYCSNLRSVTIPNSVKTIDDYAFSSCSNMTSVTISDSVTSIGSYAYSGCTSLSTVTVGNSVAVIGNSAFSSCSRLLYVHYTGTKTQWNAITIYSGNTYLTNASLSTMTASSIAIKNLPSKTQYFLGEEFDTTGLTITLTYNNGKTKELTTLFGATGYDSSTVGEKTITVTFEDCTADFTVSVKCSHSGGEATCKDQAICSICEAAYGELNAQNHKGDTYLMGQQDATCEEEGYTGDTHCADCDALLYAGEILPILPSPLFEIVSQPASIEITAGFTAQFAVEATNAASYKWQYRRNENAPWVNTSLGGNKTDTLSVPAILSRNGYQYRCRITGTDGKILYTEPAMLTVLDSITVTSQPTRQIVNVDANATFTVQAEGAGLTYQWLYRKNDDDFWKQTGMEGNKTNTLTVPAFQTRNGYQYMCAITDENGIKIYSKVAVLSAIGFTAQPEDQTVAVNANAVFSVAAKGQNLTYQWQYRKSEDGAWMNTTLTGCKTDTFTVLAIASRNGYQYRCRITDALGIIRYSDPATLTVE